MEETIPLLYVEGLSARDFKRALAPLWGKSGLSRSSVSRANKALKKAFDNWRHRDLSLDEIIYLFLDGIYLGVRGNSRNKEAVLVAHGITREGKRVVLHLSLGGRESTESWKGVLNDLERLARQTLQESSGPVRRNVFISFDSDDIALVNLLRGQAKNDNIPLEFNDFSLKEPFDSERAEYTKRGIRERIRQASVTIVYLTDNSAKSSWVNWEIEESIKLGKGVIAVYQGDTAPSNAPPALKTLGVTPVQWSADNIMTAIDKVSKKRK